MLDTVMAGETLLHYRILERADSGAMGEVYRAEDQRLRRIVALKMLPEALATEPDKLARFHHEAEILAQLHHPNIVTVFSIDETDGRRFLTMAWVEGSTLADALPAAGLPLPKLLDIGIALADAVAAAHDKGIIHWGLKPANVMIGADATPKVLDFGLAKSDGVARRSVASFGDPPPKRCPPRRGATLFSQGSAATGFLLGSPGPRERLEEAQEQAMGAKAILEQNPLARPKRSARSPAPRFHAHRGYVRRRLEYAYLRFFYGYRAAAQRFRDGKKGRELHKVPPHRRASAPG